MPNAIVIGTTVTTPVAAASDPYDLWVGGDDILGRYVDLHSIRLEDSGSSAPSTLSFDVWDMALAATVADGARVMFQDNVLDQRLFTGDIINRAPKIANLGRITSVTCASVGGYLDKIQVVSETRGAETDKARLSFLVGTFGAILPDREVGNIDSTVTLGAGSFQNMTLRSAIEQVAASAGEGRYYYIDPMGALHYYLNVEGIAAPFTVRVGTPGGGEIAPADLAISYDSTGLINAYYVRGKTVSGSGWVVDGNSVTRYGRREGSLDAPDSDSAVKRNSAGLAALGLTKDPVVRGSFSTTSPNDGWKGGQTLTVASAPQFGITSPVTYLIARVTTTWFTGTGRRSYEVEFGALRHSGWRQIGTRVVGWS